MAPQKNFKKDKNTKSKSAVTLHNFFSPSVGSSKKPITPSKKATPSKSDRRKSESKEIIVIDSDSDAEVEVASTTVQRKRRRSESSSDIELLPNGPIKRVNTVVSEPALNFGQPALLMCKAESAIATPSLSFGAPSPLLGGPLPDAAPGAGTSLFGSPSLLLLGQSDDCPSPAATDAEVEGDDEWGMGDDEIIFIPDDEDDDTTQIDEPPEAYLCPLCQKSLDELSETVCNSIPKHSHLTNIRTRNAKVMSMHV
jgi:hypothetical protein